MSAEGVWAAQLVDPDGHEETISSADPNTIVWWLERQAQRLDPKPEEPHGGVPCEDASCPMKTPHLHPDGRLSRLGSQVMLRILRKDPDLKPSGAPFQCPNTDGCDDWALCLADRGCHAIPLSGS